VGPEDLLRIRSSQKTHSRREGMTSETDLREGFWFEEATQKVRIEKMMGHKNSSYHTT
jgi:hypothetical protein